MGRHAKTLPLTHCSVGTKRLIRFDHLGLIKFKTFQDVRMHEFYDFAVGPQNTSAANGDVTLYLTGDFTIISKAPCLKNAHSECSDPMEAQGFDKNQNSSKSAE